MADFAHLHVHTTYSLLEGAIRLKPLMEKVKAGGMDAVAITDSGNLFGAVDFDKTARAAGVRPVLGAEVFVDTGDPTHPESHLVLLAKNRTGYANLTFLISQGWLGADPAWKRPRIPKPLLAKHTEGLVALSACLKGEPAQYFLAGDPDRARDTVETYRRMFAPGHYHLELQVNAYPDQPRVNDFYKELSRDLQIPLVATNDCHYLERKDARAHEALMAIQAQVSVDEMRRLRPAGDGQYVRTADEMLDLFEDVPDAVYRTAEIASWCDVDLELGKHTYLPNYEVPQGFDQSGWLREASRRGLERRIEEIGDAYPVDREAYFQRLEMELEVIISMKFPGYFLIVQDFINWAKDHDVPVGPGRGSGAGSLVAWVLRITDLDPIHHGLLFERFLNPERVSMPDFDVDFCQTRRDKVIKYVGEKYGALQVGQIATFGQLKARSVIRDVVRVMGLPFAEGDRLAKLVPSDLNITLPLALEQEPRLKELYDDRSRPEYREILDIAMALEGLNRQSGMHAAGIVIGEKPLWDYVPLFRGNDGELVTQFAKDEVEQAGLVKFDFLGLKTLTVIDHAVRLVNRDRPDDLLDINAIALDDPEVYRLISRGDTTGVFQLESSGFKELLRKLKPDRFSDIVAAVALYRPGPLGSGMVDTYIDRKHGREEVAYPHPDLERVLEETYGVIVYQEQVMEISRILAGYSLGRADILRRAMGKKKAEVMAKERVGFLAGADENGVDPRVAGEIFDLMEKFAAYGFNKSHSAAYGLITYQTAWLKTHYPVEFMTALLTSEKDNTDKVVAHIDEVRRLMGIEVLPPDVNKSAMEFDTAAPGESGALKRIRFGLGAVKGVGESAIEAILDARNGEDGGAFRGLFDFCERVDTRKVNRKTVEVLVRSGCFDFVGVPRWKMLGRVERAMDRGSRAQKDRAAGQVDLFGALAGKKRDAAAFEIERPDLYEDPGTEDEPWTERQLLAAEKEAIGFYISGHPLDRYVDDLHRFSTPIIAVKELESWQDVELAGVVTAVREWSPKRGGGRMAKITLEDLSGTLDVLCFGAEYQQYELLLKSDEPLLVKGKTRVEMNDEERSVLVRVQEVEPLAEVRARESTSLAIALGPDALSPQRADRLHGLLAAHPGDCKTYVRIRREGAWETVIRLGMKVHPGDELLTAVDHLFGQRVTEVR